ncbi:DUF421 domain-containing protein [Aminipila luticellarii]|uniref:DUF421 domain-containing protein n=1 Tax=Aminipila luticellarii TaxID=2507160 RepID=A0A410PUC8_9FIRM|nr:DUF421 domain-containing protein [Aminipila luticellarii]QAT42529.1 DUF421 domain-containing protein [Aminipila luticellarii]
MTIILIRTGILYLMVLFAIRIMGKSELSKLSPFQMVILFMIAELASLPIEDTNLSLINGTIAIFTLLFLQVTISYLSLKCEWFKNFINGRPSILIEDGAINELELKRLRININDLTEQLRLKNSPSLSDVAYAVIESNGDLSVIPKPDKRPLTPSDMGIVKPKEIMPLVLICDGFLYKSNLNKVGWDEDYLKSLLLPMKIVSYKEVLMAFCDEQKQLHVYQPSKDGKISVEVII